ncbi:MAG TPA: sugar transferase, partial [Chitinophagaceae bacterium]|nr:sugar transferase [Chitinophagaceae bacterium]
IAIKLNSRGPVFFIQRRVGRGFKSFKCIKFRTMIPNHEADEFVPNENDNRITALGKFLRKTSLDELPQFINVLIGDMSIVGPRPHMFADCSRFAGLINDYKFRNLVRPGITGLAQVKGFRGPAVDSRSIRSRFYYDSIYIKNLGWGLEINIILTTASQVIGLIFFRGHIDKRITNKKVNTDSPKIAA